MATKEYENKKFSRVEISNTYDYQITRGDAFSVKIETDEDFMKNVRVSQDGEKLLVGHSHHVAWMYRYIRPKLFITMPVIKGLRLTGAVAGDVTGFKSKDDFSLEMDGASKVTLNLQAGKTEIHLHGACLVDGKGAAESVIIDVHGASNLDLKNFVMKNAAIRLNGASNCTANITDRLDVRLAGVSTLNLIGAPTMGEIRSSGMSKISQVS